MHHCDSWRIKDQLDVTCYFISLLMCSTCFGHNISIIRNLPLFCWITTLVVLFLIRCVLEFRYGIKNNTTNVVIQQNSGKFLMMDILCPKHVEHIRSEIKQHVTSSWSFILQLSNLNLNIQHRSVKTTCGTYYVFSHKPVFFVMWDYWYWGCQFSFTASRRLQNHILFRPRGKEVAL